MSERVFRGMCPTCLYATRKVHRFKKVVTYEEPDGGTLRVIPLGAPLQSSFQLGTEGRVEAFEEDGKFHVHIVTPVIEVQEQKPS